MGIDVYAYAETEPGVFTLAWLVDHPGATTGDTWERGYYIRESYGGTYYATNVLIPETFALGYDAICEDELPQGVELVEFKRMIDVMPDYTVKEDPRPLRIFEYEEGSMVVYDPAVLGSRMEEASSVARLRYSDDDGYYKEHVLNLAAFVETGYRMNRLGYRFGVYNSF